MIVARSVMTTPVITVDMHRTLGEVLKVLTDSGVSGLPVVKEDMTLVGMVTQKDVLTVLFRSNDQDVHVSDFMTRKVVSFDENDSLLDVCDSLICHGFRRVPILSGGKLAGIVARGDIIRYVLHLRQGGEPSRIA